MPQAAEIVARLGEYGVGRVVCASYDAKSSVDAAALADKYREVFATVAFHPHESKSYTDGDAKLFCRLAKNKKVLAIGETGLDYYYDLSERSVQRRVFAEHIELADALGLPVVVHIRDAYEDAIAILTANRAKLNNGVLIHNFSGSVETMRALDELGCYYSFGGTITFKNNKKGAEALLAADKSKILLETDCPYLTPEPHRGKLNFPYYVKHVAERCAEILDIDFDALCALTEKNVESLFKRLNGGAGAANG
jgi:TatD DNase family protein